MAEGKRYTTLLSSKGHGHPVSLPNLSEDLPPSLRKSGLLLGDVCILHGDGSVEPLFNITYPEGDFTNRLGVPSNFEQLILYPDDVRTQVLCHPPGSVISNVTVHKKDISVNANFECDNLYVHCCRYIVFLRGSQLRRWRSLRYTRSLATGSNALPTRRRLELGHPPREGLP
jgi:hypothetical protein